MAGVPSSERNQRPGEENLVGSPLNPLSQFLRLGQEHALPEEYDYSDEPERKRLFWIHRAAVELNGFLTLIGERFGSLPVNCKTALQTGRFGHKTMALFTTRVPDEMTPLYHERLSAVVAEIDGIVREKGFIDSEALWTPREHHELGSSGYGGIYAETDPDIPVPILRDQLIKSGKMDPEEDPNSTIFTIEEVDRARRLMGMITLDPETGRVTGQIDEEAANDSYIYLSPERRAEVMAREVEILAEVAEIAKKAREEHEKSVAILPALDAYSRGERAFVEVKDLYHAVLARLSERDRLNLDGPIKELRKIAFAAGKWDHLLTPQEILLRVGAGIDERYLAKPYTPIAVQDGEPAEEVSRLREAEGSIVVNTALLEYERPFGFRLEDLGENGDTSKSPTFLAEEFGEEEMSERAVEFYKDQVRNFPFARPEDWYYQE